VNGRHRSPAVNVQVMGDVTGVLRDDILLERYRYPPGPAVVLPRHSHAEYQLNLNLGGPGGVRYRGAYHVVPPRTLSVIMPGEPHTPRDPDARTQDSTHLTLYVPAMPKATFPDLIVPDEDLITRFIHLHTAFACSSSTLDQDTQLLTLLTDLAHRHGNTHAPRLKPAHSAVRRAQDYLHANQDTNVSLTDLARVTGLSQYHLTRSFTATIGVPPHTYQIQLRIERAKRLLLTGRPVVDSAHEAGFYDLSHFTRHFKRHVGVPPGAYAHQQDRTSAGQGKPSTLDG
jgi:AraC-like DNA-binding protein